MSGSATAQERRPEPVVAPRVVMAPAAMIGSPEQVQAGRVLIKPGTPLPHGVVPSLRRVGHWNLIADLPTSELGRTLRSEGWNLFFVVPPVEDHGIGWSFQKALRKALAGMVLQVDARGLNAIEIASVRVRRFLGLHYVAVTGFPRHIRGGNFLHDPDPYHQVSGMWNFRRIFDAMNRRRPQAKSM